MSKLITVGTSPYLDKHKINDYDYIVGPHLINGNHWLALIIDMCKKRFILIDPMQVFFDFNSNYECWLNYYNQRKDTDLTISWHKDLFQPHPIQTDFFNCGIFTINFIHQYVINGRIDFSTDPKYLFSCRQQVANKIKEFFH